MNKDLAAVTAVWRALLGVRNRALLCDLLSFCQIAAEDVLRRMMGPSLETGAVFDAALSGNAQLRLCVCDGGTRKK